MPSTELTHVHVAKFSVSKIFDDKYKAKLPELMRKTAAKHLEKSKLLTVKPPKDKKAPGFYLDGSLKVAMGEKAGKTLLAGEVKLVMATWPKKSMFAFPSGTAKIVANPNDLEGDIRALVEALVTSVVKDQAVKEFEKRSKKLATAK